MHFHYYTLCRLRDYLNHTWKGIQVLDCFSQNKRELVILSETIALRIGCNTPLSYIVPVPNYSKAGRNVATLFTVLQGAVFSRCEVIPMERVMVLYFSEGYELILKMHRIQANIILRKDKETIGLFIQSFRKDENFIPTSGSLDWGKAQEMLTLNAHTEDKIILKIMREVSPIFDLNFVKRWKQWVAIQSPIEALKSCISEGESGSLYICKHKEGILFSLFPEENSIIHDNIEEALFLYLKLYFQLLAYTTTWNSLKKSLTEPYQKLKGVYESYLHTIRQLEAERSAEEIGHLIFANLTRIEREMTELVVEDFYNDNQLLTIKLKKELTGTENAEAFFRKHKARKAKRTYLENELPDMETKLIMLEEKADCFMQIPSPALLILTSNGFEANALKALKRIEKQEVAEMMRNEYPYRYFEKEGWQIFVGKNAKNNDNLLRFADKNDWWLHAREVSGSHVIIRQRSGQNLPEPILEYAAGIAAWFSKSRTQALVPVIYTLRKFVRKRKGSAAGEVVVSRESVILTVPIKAGDTEE